MTFLKPKVLDIRKQYGNSIQQKIIPKLMAFPACKENLSKRKENLVALEALQDPEDSE